MPGPQILHNGGLQFHNDFVNMDKIQQALGTQYAMYYNPSMSVSELTPQQTLAQSIDIVNTRIKQDGLDILAWHLGFQDEVTRLLNVNWIFQRLDQEPIRKPILVHKEHEQYQVDCGDTRLMALGLLDTPPTVGVVITCLKQVTDYANWLPVYTEADLIKYTKLEDGAVYLTSCQCAWAIEWLEIGNTSTAHHLHSLDTKLDMMNNYLKSQHSDFTFTEAWARTPINWDQYR